MIIGLIKPVRIFISKKAFERKKKEYEQAQENYAKFADANKNIILQSYRAEQVRLENEMNLAYQVYTSVAQQLQMAEAKVQEITLFIRWLSLRQFL